MTAVSTRAISSNAAVNPCAVMRSAPPGDTSDRVTGGEKQCGDGDYSGEEEHHQPNARGEGREADARQQRKKISGDKQREDNADPMRERRCEHERKQADDPHARIERLQQSGWRATVSETKACPKARVMPSSVEGVALLRVIPAALGNAAAEESFVRPTTMPSASRRRTWRKAGSQTNGSSQIAERRPEWAQSTAEESRCNPVGSGRRSRHTL